MPNTFKIGDIEVLVLSDGVARAPGTMYFPGTTTEQWAEHKRWLDHQGNVEFPFSCFLVRAGDRRILIDTGLGQTPLVIFRGGALLGELAAAGVNPEDIDTVFVTHLHIDHCGTTVLPGSDGVAQPAFPNATYRWTAAEHDYWSRPDGGLATGAASPEIKTYVEGMFSGVADRYKPAEDGEAIAPGVNVISTPGHTPGHAAVILSSGGQRAFILGDAISCPVQLTETEWSGMGDADPKLARRTQETVVREIESDGALMTAAHFPGLTFGRVLTGEGRRYWEPV
jgi:glyoxylase-like metal-dependent hydrolase (beta-lactamase superfamily II)